MRHNEYIELVNGVGGSAPNGSLFRVGDELYFKDTSGSSVELVSGDTDSVLFNPQSATPSADEGRLYYDDAFNSFFYYDGASWTEIGASIDAVPSLLYTPQSATPSADEGRLYYDDLLNKFFYYNGSSWTEVGAETTEVDSLIFTPQSATPTLTEGRLYYDDALNKLFLYDGSEWIQVGSEENTNTVQQDFVGIDTWLFNHGLGINPHITVLDTTASTPTVIEPEFIDHIDLNNVTIRFNGAQTGTAIATGGAKSAIIDDTKLPLSGGTMTGDILASTPGLDLGNVSQPWDNVYTTKLESHTIPAGSDSLVTEDSTQTLTNKTISNPTIGDFTNSGHDHSDTAKGGTVAITLDQAYNGGRTIEVDTGPIICATPQSSNGDIKFCLRSSDPSSPTEGEFWYNSADKKLKFYDGTVIISLPNTANISTHPTLTNNISAYWKMDEDGSFPDEVGGFTGTIDGATFVPSAALRGGYDFNGTDDDILFNATAQIIADGTNPFSVSMWINLDIAPTSGNQMALCQFRQASDAQWLTSFFNDGGTYKFYQTFRGGANAGAYITISENDLVGDYHHVVFVYKGGTKSTIANYDLYIDNVLITTNKTAIFAGGSNNANGLGHDLQSGGARLNGKLDEIGVWKRELTVSEINDLFNSGAPFSYD